MSFWKRQKLHGQKSGQFLPGFSGQGAEFQRLFLGPGNYFVSWHHGKSVSSTYQEPWIVITQRISINGF